MAAVHYVPFPTGKEMYIKKVKTDHTVDAIQTMVIFPHISVRAEWSVVFLSYQN